MVVYSCEACARSQSRKIEAHTEGLCPVCGSLMRIDDLFSDRRAVQQPVALERRAA